MAKIKCSIGNRNLQCSRVTEYFASILISLFAVGSWGVRRRRRLGVRPPRLHSANRRRRRRSRSGCGCGCIAIIFLIPIIILFGGLVLFRTEIIEIIYNLTGFELPF